MGLSWELGSWPMGHLRSPSTTRTGATKQAQAPCSPLPAAPRPLRRAPLRPTHRALRSKGRIGSQGSAPRGFVSRLSCLHPSPLSSAVLQGRLSTLFSGLITFRIKAKPSPGCEYNAPRASRGEEKGCGDLEGTAAGVAGGGGWWDVTRLQQVSAAGVLDRPSRPEPTLRTGQPAQAAAARRARRR